MEEQKVPLSEVERAIQCIDGVLKARVVGDERSVSEIHVLARPSKPPKLLVRDVETLLKAKFGLEVDHKKISVVAFDVGENDRAESSYAVQRPVLWSVSWRKSMNRAQSEVEIRFMGKIYRASAEEEGWSGRGWNHLIAEATLDCLNQIVGVPSFFALRGVAVRDFGDVEVALSFVDCRPDKGSGSMLVGTALVGDEVAEAVARATLDAVNRRLILYVENQP
ncbi:MAG: hypothetical protein PWP42_385 [Candidatus Atribacteria bacterium]|jgi:hypothetical protein|uniref:hypothetical protein n=1 Tax=Atrimonas thermophila TaxID=3064161 RepID=UPI0024ABCB15|nr:hypothetical protein [Candidatus Atribacteria bacterium]